jgi:hypothetical protein
MISIGEISISDINDGSLISMLEAEHISHYTDEELDKPFYQDLIPVLVKNNFDGIKATMRGRGII